LEYKKEEMTPEFLDQAEKTAKQFATGFRSLAKLCALASGLGSLEFPKNEATEQKTEEPWGVCEACGYETDHRSSWNKHLASEKHKLKEQLKSLNLYQ